MANRIDWRQFGDGLVMNFDGLMAVTYEDLAQRPLRNEALSCGKTS